MKKLTIICGMAALLATAPGCQKIDGIDDDLSFMNSNEAPTSAGLLDITNDNSGNVTITPTGQGASSFIVNFGHGTGAGASAVVRAGQSVTHSYPEGSYTVTIVARSLSGVETTSTHPLQLTYRAPEDINIETSAQVHMVRVKATAKYAASYLVYYGDDPGAAGQPLAAGAEVSHTYPSAGTYTVRIVALSGGAAQAEATKDVTVYDALGFPITFETPTINYFFGTFGDNQQFAKVANPNPSGLNTSATVGRFTRGNQGWSGTYTPLDLPIDFAVGKVIRVLAYNPDAAMIGKKLNVELENGPVANGVGVLKTAFTTSGAWEELVFDFSGFSTIPAGSKFGQLVLRFADDVEGAGIGGAGSIIYVDNFRLTN